MSTMGDQSDARTKARIPFEAVVEVADTGDSDPYEAQAVDVSGEGMHLRTAYLPDVGQSIACRFDAGADPVTVTGAVVWRQAESRGGEFGIRFNEMDPDTAKALEAIVGTSTPEGVVSAMPKGRVRLHIEGLGQPMRARVKTTSATELTVGSDLAFLQVGKHLELEDAELGGKRPAVIDRVEVETDPDSHVPRLVVALRYEPLAVSDAARMPDSDADAARPTVRARTSEPNARVLPADERPDGTDEEAASMKSTFARNAAKVTPAVLGLLKRAREKAANLSARGASTDEAPARRTTSPAPGGGLKTSGRGVVRDKFEAAPPTGMRAALEMHKRKIALGGSAFLAVLLVAAAMHKPSSGAVASAPAPLDSAALAPLTELANAPPVNLSADAGPAPAVDPMLVATAPSAAPAPMPPAPLAVTPPDPPPAAKPSGPVHATPFSNGSVTHGNVLRLKMDGAIEKINGAQQPAGFSVSIPGHKSLEPAGPLASRDSRIASIRVTNDQGGAELEVAFKDGVPNYVVRSKGDTLEIVLAPIATASHDAPAKPAKHVDPSAKPSKPSKKTAHAKH